MHIILCALFHLLSFGLLTLPLNGANRVSKTQVENSTRWESFLVHESALVVSSILFILYFVTCLGILYIQVDCSVVQHEYLNIMNI